MLIYRKYLNVMRKILCLRLQRLWCSMLGSVEHYDSLGVEKRREVRRLLLCLDDTAKKVSKLPGIPASEIADLNKLRKDLTRLLKAFQLWVIFAVALALGGGTMIGWRRIVYTVGEKIGQKGMTYSQGMAAQITGCSDWYCQYEWFACVYYARNCLLRSLALCWQNRSGLQSGTVITWHWHGY